MKKVILSEAFILLIALLLVGCGGATRTEQEEVENTKEINNSIKEETVEVEGENTKEINHTINEETAEADAENMKESNHTIKGEIVEADAFTITIAEGFEKMDISGGIQAYKGREAVEVWVRGSGLNETEGEKAAASLANDYKGTNPEKTNIFGIDFYSTTFVANGISQTIYVGIKDGQKIQIGITGEEHEKNDILQGMFMSIHFN